jgi:hypothetical protein
MRRVCTALVDDLCLPVPAEPQQLFEALSAKMSQLRGRPVRHLLVAFPPCTVTGLWVATDDMDYVFCEQHTSLVHQLRIFFHEFWHLYDGHEGGTVGAALGLDDNLAPSDLVPAIGQDQLARIIAARSPCSRREEEDAELFAWLLTAKVSRWMHKQQWTVPEHAADIIGRLEAVLAYRRGEAHHG